jgi:uncharacterized membrane protein YbhN (UPF0104 family)
MKIFLLIKAWINTFIRVRYYSYIRRSHLFKATLIKKFSSLIVILIGVFFLAIWGIELIFEQRQLSNPNPSKFLVLMWPLMPWMKLVAILLPYMNFISELYFSFTSLRRRVEYLKMIRDFRTDSENLR